ncbi:hypothetical protein NECAME_12115 [Necator americanus]|uniref:Uncharacterized protein n=1 Tax=Necator americanus TaxID=51031 RepID=W2T3L5_NECAM|nr:hypothetical protein NECAME_12115 [Necator americanus]ETN75806.1 hypothetical protein NECAME_12115 [Necator americanus]
MSLLFGQSDDVALNLLGLHNQYSMAAFDASVQIAIVRAARFCPSCWLCKHSFGDTSEFSQELQNVL